MHMGSLYPPLSWLGDPTAMPAGFSPAAAPSCLAWAGRLPSSLGAGVGLAIIACTLMAVTSSLRETRYLQQTCAWHLAANPGISGCRESGRWSLARPETPGRSAARGLGTIWAARDPGRSPRQLGPQSSHLELLGCSQGNSHPGSPLRCHPLWGPRESPCAHPLR